MKEVYGNWYTDWKFFDKYLLQEKTMFWVWHSDLIHICNELDVESGLIYGACRGIFTPLEQLKEILYK